MSSLADWWMRLDTLAQILSVIGGLVVATLAIIILHLLWVGAVREPWDRHKDRVKMLASHDRSMRGLIDWKESSQFHIREMQRRLTDVEKLRKRIQVLEQRWEQPEETGDLK